MRGYWGIGIWCPKTFTNYGSLFRTAQVLDANMLFVIGARFKRQATDTMKSWRHLPVFAFDTFDEFQKARPYDCQLVGVELTSGATLLESFSHPERAIYLLGAEDHGLTPKILNQCQHVIKLRGDRSMNVAVAGSIVAYSRGSK